MADGRRRGRHTRPAVRGLPIAALLIAALILVLAPAAWGAAPVQDINTAGPLTNVWIGTDLSCQTAQAGNSTFEFYPSDSASGDCGTFLSTGPSTSPVLYGPDFQADDVGTATPFVNNTASYKDFGFAATAPAVAGSGTAASPYRVTNAVVAGRTGLGITETDSYVVGSEAYRTDITVTNAGAAAASVRIYHAADCYLQGSDDGFGYVSPTTDGPACTANAYDAPAGQVEEFAPITAGIHYVEAGFSNVWDDVATQTDLPDACDCGDYEDNGEGVNWDVTVPAGGSSTVSMQSNFSSSGALIGAPPAPAVLTGPASGVTQTAATLNGTVNPELGNVTNCQFDWGTSTAYDNSAPCAQAVGAGAGPVAVSAPLGGLAPGTTYHFRLEATNAGGTSYGADQTVSTFGVPAISVSAPVAKASGAVFSAVIVPNGLATTAHFEYGLDPKYFGGGPVVYNESTPAEAVGADFAAHAFPATVSGLVPNALYHERLVASNSAGTTTGPDKTFTTGKAPPPPPPVIGKSANVTPVSGLVLIKVPAGKTFDLAHSVGHKLVKGKGFLPLTQVRQIPIGSQIDARAGTIRVVVASQNRHHTQKATAAGSVFSLSQTRKGIHKGLTTFGLLEGAFSGAPSYRSCTAKKTARTASDLDAQVARLSRRVLQTLKARDNGGRFRTRGRYSAGTVRGTWWITTDRCDGTLTTVKRGTVNVLDFRSRKTVAVHAGHSYLVRALAARRA